MSIYQFSKDDIALMVGAAINDASVQASHFDILALRPTVAGDNSAYNTKIHIRFNATGNYSGEVSLFYNRVSFDSLSNFSPFSVNGVRKVDGDSDVSVYTLLNEIRDGLGIQLTSDDIVETQGSDNPDTGGTQVTLIAKPTSIGWTGTYTLQMLGYPNIMNAMFGANLTGF